MKLQFCATNALVKWLKVDLPRLPVESGKRVGMNTLSSDHQTFSWQVHIIDNCYQSPGKTIIATEANSRFSLFIPVDLPLTLDELTQRLLMEWQHFLVVTLEIENFLPHSDIACLLAKLDEIAFDIHWVKNTDLSISGHISDAGLWVTETLSDRGLASLSVELALDLAVFLNTKIKRIKKRKEKFVPIKSLFAYCQKVLLNSDDKQIPVTVAEAPETMLDLNDKMFSNVVYLKDYMK